MRAPMIYRYAWGNNSKRAELKGRFCVVEAAGALGSVQIRFLDNDQTEIVSRRALRAARDDQGMGRKA
jgi:hypothetical protein